MESAMKDHAWVKELPYAITVLDDNGIVLEMNDKSAATFAADGGAALVGKSALECHPEPSRSKLQQMLKEPKANIYTIEKAGVRKLICQTPWFRDGKFSGIVELSIVIPFEMPHFVRD
jgi:transcriptional regulator with PAS, ATPase and Fis domain